MGGRKKPWEKGLECKRDEFKRLREDYLNQRRNRKRKGLKRGQERKIGPI